MYIEPFDIRHIASYAFDIPNHPPHCIHTRDSQTLHEQGMPV
jgi:hypothetical protein